MNHSEISKSKIVIDRLSVAICVESKLEKVALARAVLGGILHEVGVPESDAMLLQLAVTEVVNNSIEHGYKSEPDHKVEIFLAAGDDGIRIAIADDAPPMPVNRMKELLKAAEIDQNSEGIAKEWGDRGHGLEIVRRAVDSLDFSWINDRNCVTMHKRFS
jgi:anti-sigma regulatory factor (Ser/Thr protein kinase)